jgi:hypothetical protein
MCSEDLDPLDAIISLADASRLSGLAAHTLALQAERGKLHARKVGHSWITTRHWLDQYLSTHARGRGSGSREGRDRPIGSP